MWKTILRKSKGVIRVFFISLYVIAVIVTWVLSISYINKRLENQMLTFIDEIAREKAAWIDSIMVAKLGLLESMADELAELENYIFSMEIEDIIELKEWMGVDGLAFIDDNGCAYTSEGKIEDVSDEPIYQIAIDGVPYISGLLESTENEKGIIVYGVPIISPEGDKSSIIGVLAATTKAENFILEYSPKSNQEKGYIYIIDNEGNIIEGTASMDELEMDNILEQVKKRKGNPVAIEKLEKALANHKKTNLYYENNGENYAVCVPLNMNEWSMMRGCN